MDVRVHENGIDLYECERLTKEEFEFISMLLSAGGYWELRKNGIDTYTLHDKGNYKYKGSLKEIKCEIGK